MYSETEDFLWLQLDYSGDYDGSGDYEDDPVGGVPPALIQPLMQLLASLDSNTTVDLSSPHLRSLFSKNTWLLVIVIVLYTLLIILGLLGNLLLLIMLLRLKPLSKCFSCICSTFYQYLDWTSHSRKRLYLGCPIQCCVLSTVIAALLQLTVTLPMSLFVLIVHNWLLGRAMCYLLPMLQDLPSYVIMLSLLAISFERWRSLLSKAIVRVNMNLVLPLIWLVSTLMVLPYNAFISHFYLDVSSQTVSLISYQKSVKQLSESSWKGNWQYLCKFLWNKIWYIGRSVTEDCDAGAGPCLARRSVLYRLPGGWRCSLHEDPLLPPLPRPRGRLPRPHDPSLVWAAGAAQSTCWSGTQCGQPPTSRWARPDGAGDGTGLEQVGTEAEHWASHLALSLHVMMVSGAEAANTLTLGTLLPIFISILFCTIGKYYSKRETSN